jgi:FKBP-type peptidyl-prolyl cis-trans isomerase
MSSRLPLCCCSVSHLCYSLFYVCCYYVVQGEEFDSSFKRGRPAVFAPNQVIKGWTEAMQLMHEGDHWQLTIPSGEHGQIVTTACVQVEVVMCQ